MVIFRINNTAADPGTNYHVSNYASGNIISSTRPLSTCSAPNTSMPRFAEKMISNGSRLAFRPASPSSEQAAGAAKANVPDDAGNRVRGALSFGWSAKDKTVPSRSRKMAEIDRATTLEAFLRRFGRPVAVTI